MSPTLALFLAVFGALLLVAVLLDDMAARIRVPGILLVLVLGLLTDNRLDALPGQVPPLLSLSHADQIAQLALVLVLFFGGLTTNWRELRPVLQPALRLATLGSLLTALLLTLLVLALGRVPLPVFAIPLSLPLALFVGAMVCSTDASAVIALLRPLNNHLPRRLIDLIETESAFNDPVAVVLAGLALAMASGQGSGSPAELVAAVLRQFLLGALLGFLGGSLARQLLAGQAAAAAGPLLPVLSLAVLLLLVGATQLLGGSGLLAAYIAGLVLGNAGDCDRPLLVDAHAGFAKMAELMLFLCMGLVVQPEDVVREVVWAVLLFAAMLLVRWLMVQLLLVNSGFDPAAKLFVAASGLRGAVPIALAIQAAASPIPWGRAMPPLALGVVLLGLGLQGLALVPMARRLGLSERA
ncbi:cation:proton antiporter [Cyanobium sp. ATX 6A2]|uniref:cation:proton antiporter domain-containing protein n=1 Tax=Cyanobium sp. ATX 6A2 TaxID=2823700 RepID=UPI0020CFA0E8|nr:cation:proton antiporter [Cyanobium sp. ATX 6A2]MCP9889208.1 cation:proton antiporter [Cyanobium sp. ATX 6A2]